MDIFEAIKNRRSIRDYNPSKKVPKDAIEKIVDAARWAPSAGNQQPIEVVAVSEKEKERSWSQHLETLPTSKTLQWLW